MTDFTKTDDLVLELSTILDEMTAVKCGKEGEAICFVRGIIRHVVQMKMLLHIGVHVIRLDIIKQAVCVTIQVNLETKPSDLPRSASELLELKDNSPEKGQILIDPSVVDAASGLDIDCVQFVEMDEVDKVSGYYIIKSPARESSDEDSLCGSIFEAILSGESNEKSSRKSSPDKCHVTFDIDVPKNPRQERRDVSNVKREEDKDTDMDLEKLKDKKDLEEKADETVDDVLQKAQPPPPEVEFSSGVPENVITDVCERQLDSENVAEDRTPKTPEINPDDISTVEQKDKKKRRKRSIFKRLFSRKKASGSKSQPSEAKKE